MTRLKRTIFVPDCHVPFHDVTAYKLMLSVCRDFKPDEVVVLGDFFDFYSVSRHEKDPSHDFKLFKDELDASRGVLAQLEVAARTKKLTFLSGNHENRLKKYISSNTPKLHGLLKTEKLLGIDEKWQFIEYGQNNRHKVGNLVATHGGRPGEHPASAMVKKWRHSVVFGHCHKIQEHHLTNINGQDWVGLSPGWLGDETKAAEYLIDVSDWSKGFLLVWTKPNGEFFYQMVHVKEGKKGQRECFFNNKKYQKR